MLFSELLAQDEGFPIQGIIFLIVAIFSFVKWLYENISGKKKEDADTDEDLESIYEQYREEIRERQTQLIQPTPEVSSQAPPPLPASPPAQSSVAQPAKPAPKSAELTPQAPLFRQEDIERLRNKKAQAAYTIQGDTPSSRPERKTRSLRSELQKKNSLRKAILLREIIEPPKALQQQD